MIGSQFSLHMVAAIDWLAGVAGWIAVILAVVAFAIAFLGLSFGAVRRALAWAGRRLAA